MSLMPDVQPSSTIPPLKEISAHPKELDAEVCEDLETSNLRIMSRVDTVPPNIIQEAGQWDGKGLKTFPDPSMELSSEAQVLSMRRVGSAQLRHDSLKGRRATLDGVTPLPISLPPQQEAYHSLTESKERPPQIQNGNNPSIMVDFETHDSLGGSNTRPSAIIDAPIRTRVSSTIPTPILVTSAPSIPTPAASTIPSVDPRSQVLLSLSPQDTPHPVNSQPLGNFATNSTSTSAPNPIPRLSPSTGNNHAPSNTLSSSQKANFVQPPSLTSAFPYFLPHPPIKESDTRPVPSPALNVPPHVHTHQSSANMTPSAQTSSLPILSLPTSDRTVVLQELHQSVVTGSKADPPPLPNSNKEESMVILTFSIFSKALIFFSCKLV